MAIRTVLRNKDALDVIEKGADVSSDKEKEKKEWVNFTLRIRKDLLQSIDEDLEDHIGLSKTAWILGAIQNKLAGW